MQAVPLSIIDEEFPFHKFFDDAPKPLFKKRSYEEDMEIADGCFRYALISRPTCYLLSDIIPELLMYAYNCIQVH